MKHIAIIGSGPAGCYLADHLLRLVPNSSIDVLEKLPVPFGLIRYGVAPDHLSIRSVRTTLEKVIQRPEIRFLGGIEVVSDVSVSELHQYYLSLIHI